MNQLGLFDYNKRLAHIDNAGDSLAELNKVIDWEQFSITHGHCTKSIVELGYHLSCNKC